MKIYNKISKVATIVAATAFFFNSCQKIEDINTNPYSATEINPSLLVPQVLTGLSANRTIELNAVNMNSQQWSAIVGFGVFTNPERYNISSNTVSNLWANYYTTSLRNLKQIRVLTEKNNPGAKNIIGQAKALEAFTYLTLTQVFGSIPLSEALDVDNFPTPKFDKQADVLRGIVNLAQEAANNLKTDTDIITDADLIYKGDRSKWLRFANSLQLKALMLIANVDPTSVISEIKAISNQPLITSVSDVAKLDYLATPGNENPIWKTIDQYNGGVNGFWGAGKTLVDLMNTNNDPRRAVYFDDVNGEYVGQKQGVFSSSGISAVSLNIIKETMPDIYMNASEINFYLAEAAIKGWISGDANSYYQNGIRSSFDFYDNYETSISPSDKDAYLNSNRGKLNGSNDENLKKIHEEIYVANFTRGIEAWTNWRRNKVPTFELPEKAVLQTPIRRYNVPLDEETSNPNAIVETDLAKPMWFEK